MYHTMTFLKQTSKATRSKNRATEYDYVPANISLQDWWRLLAWTSNATMRFHAEIFEHHLDAECFHLYVCVRPNMLGSKYWPFTLAMTVPAAPRMSTELRVWCLLMMALRTRSNSAKRSCTRHWRPSGFSEEKKLCQVKSCWYQDLDNNNKSLFKIQNPTAMHDLQWHIFI